MHHVQRRTSPLARAASLSGSAESRSRLPITCLILAVLPALLACGENLGPDRGDPARFKFSENFTFSCGAWYPRPPDVTLGLFDVAVGRSASAPNDRPSDGAIRALVRAGGTVVYRFNVGKVRVILPIANAGALGKRLVAVTDPRRAEDTVTVGFRGAIVTEEVTRLGGRILGRSDNTGTAIAWIPDPLVPNLRRVSRVEYVEDATGVLCLT